MRDVPEQAETKPRSAPKPRLQVTSLFITLQTDTLRLDSFVAFDGNTYVGATHDIENDSHEQCPVQFLVCKKDRAAYMRAVAAFNEIMDEHEAGEAAKNARRRNRAKASGQGELRSSPSAACRIVGGAETPSTNSRDLIGEGVPSPMRVSSSKDVETSLLGEGVVSTTPYPFRAPQNFRNSVAEALS